MKKNINIINCERIVIYIAVIFSCLTGAQILGLSLNKVALLPLEVYILFLLINRRQVIFSKERRLLLLWYIAVSFSSIVGLLNSKQLEGYEKRLIFNILQFVFIYIPIALGVDCLKDGWNIFRGSILFVAKLNCLWGILQFIFWYMMKIDLNSLFFMDILHGVLGTEWTDWSYETGNLAIRVTGFNLDPAFFAVLMVLGFVFSEKWYWKVVYFGAVVLAMSRVGIMTLILLIIYMEINRFKKRRSKIKLRSVFKGTIIGLFLVLLCIVAYNSITFVKYQFDYVISRMMALKISMSDTGTLRHIMYFPVALLVWLFDFPIIYKLFGIGPRVAGTAFVYSSNANKLLHLNTSMLSSAWAIECDLAEILLGTGICGFVLYYSLLIRINKIHKNTNISLKFMMFALMVFGIMYDVSMLTIINLLLCFSIGKNGILSVDERTTQSLDFKEGVENE